MSNFTILMDSSKYLQVTQNRVLYVGENYAEIIQFLVPKSYNDHDLTAFTCTLQYVDSQNNAHVEVLTQDEDIYKENYIRYTLPVTSHFTYVAGNVKLQLVLTHVDETLLIQYVINSSELTIQVQPHSDYYKFSDDSLEKMTTLIGELDAKIGYIASATEYIATKTPDDLTYDDTGTLHLSIGGTAIGTGQNVGTIEISDDEDNNNNDGIINLNDIYSEVEL